MSEEKMNNPVIDHDLMYKPSYSKTFNNQEITSQFKDLPEHTPNLKSIDNFLSILSIDERNLSNQLLIGAEKGDIKSVYAILHQSINPNHCIGLRGYTPLHYAAKGGHFEVAQLLLQFGHKINLKNQNNETSLHLASENGSLPLVEFLLDKGANINALTIENETPLFFASRRGHFRVIRMLIRRGTDISIENRYGDLAEDEITNNKFKSEFREGVHQYYDGFGVGQEELGMILAYLDVRSLCTSAQVSDRWYRATEEPELWKSLGVSRWELALSSSVGIGITAPMASFRPGQHTRHCFSPRQKSRPVSSGNSSLVNSSLNWNSSNSIFLNNRPATSYSSRR